MPQSPSQFYKCPHCGHILLKDPTVMSLAGTGAGLGIIGGGCPDCHQPLDAESVYVACKYDITVTEIVRGKHGPDVNANILASHRAGKVTLTLEEISLLSAVPSPPPSNIPVSPSTPRIEFKRKDLWYIIPIVLIVIAVVFTCVFMSQPKQAPKIVPPTNTVPAAENIPTPIGSSAGPVLVLSTYGISLPYDPADWTEINGTLVLQGLGDCQLWGAETIYNEVPDKPADIKADDGNLVYDVYLRETDVTTAAAYFIRSGIPGYDFTSQGSMPVVLYANSNTATWDVCSTAVIKLLTNIAP